MDITKNKKQKTKNVNKCIENEVSVLENILRAQVSSVSFHQPSKEILDNSIKVTKYINTYDKSDMKDFHYISDSNMNFKENIMEAVSLKKHEHFQILIHPIWWGKNLNSTEEIWKWGLKEAFLRMQRQIIETERAYGLKKEIIIQDEK